jgi:hypothetical protein
VRQGDCLSSIASQHGFLWETIWFDSSNQKLRSVRKNPNALLPGDRLTIPERNSNPESCAAENRHLFRQLGTAKLRLRLLTLGEPRQDLEYSLEINNEDELIEDSTDSDGYVEVPIRSNATSATLTLHTEEGDEVYPLSLGTLNPVDSVSGAQQRLFNLGYDCGPADGIMGDRTRSALASFQAEKEVELTERIDEQTSQELEKAHGS